MIHKEMDPLEVSIVVECEFQNRFPKAEIRRKPGMFDLSNAKK